MSGIALRWYLRRRLWLAAGLVMAAMILSAVMMVATLRSQGERARALVAVHRLTVAAERVDEALLRLPRLASGPRTDLRRALDDLRAELDAFGRALSADRALGRTVSALVTEIPAADGASPATDTVHEAAVAASLEAAFSSYLALATPLARKAGPPAAEELSLLALLDELAQIHIEPALARVSAALEAEADAGARRPVVAVIALTALGLVAVFASALLVGRPLERAVLASHAALVAERDRALAAERAKQDFLSVVSHELRTPLNGILGFASLLLAADLRPEHRRQVEIIQSSGKALLRLVNDILDLARLDAGVLAIEDEPFAPREVITEVMALLRASAAAKGLEMGLYIDPALPERIRGDANRLRQILTNLVGNAVKFTEAGSVGVEARVVPAALGGAAQLEIAVMDTGIGIPADKQAAIFERFTQLDLSARRKFEGTGLGLAICRELAERMGGEISVESAPGQGSVFTLRLPFRPVEADDEVSGGAAGVIDAEAPGQVSGGGRVLVIDDNPINRRLFRLQLGAAGFEVVEAEDGETALELLAAADEADGAPAAAVIDHRMPGIDGPGLARRLRDEARFAALRLVLASSTPGDLAADEAKLFDAVLEKPARPEELLAALGPDVRAEGSAEFAAGRGPGHRILLVEDEASGRALVAGMLAPFDCIVEPARDGFEALRLAALGDFDLVLLDLRLPAMDGLDTTRRLRRLRGAERLPVVAMTAGALDDAARANCLEAGITWVIEKPFDVATLAAAVAEATGRELARRDREDATTVARQSREAPAGGARPTGS